MVQAQCDDSVPDSIELYKREITVRIRSFASPEQYERDADFEDTNGDRNSKSVTDYGQGDNAVFDE